MIQLDQFILAGAPLNNISNIILELEYQLTLAHYAVQNMLIGRSNVTALENKANYVS